MASSNSVTHDLPLISWHPVSDTRHAWVALLAAPESETSIAAFARLCRETDFFAATGDLSCILPLVDLAQLDGAQLPALMTQFDVQRMILRLPLALCLAPAAAETLGPWQQAGFRLMVDGLPGAATLPASITALAVTLDAGAESPPVAHAGLPGPYLADAVHTMAGFAACQATGYTWFAGDYALHPGARNPMQSHGPSHALLLKLLGLVTSDAEVHAIEDLLKQAPELSYQLLKLVNSVSFSPNKRIASFSHAIAMLGRRQLQRWLQLLLYAQQRSAATNPLLPRAALRASLCEALCRAQGGDQTAQENAFMAGMFSLLDVLFGQALGEILAPLNLAEEPLQALLQRSGALGNLLQLAERAEQAPSPVFLSQLLAVGIAPDVFCRLQLQALRWTHQISQGN